MIVKLRRIFAGTTATENLAKKLVPKHDRPEKGRSAIPVAALPLTTDDYRGIRKPNGISYMIVFVSSP
jgi:hypothetical protein